jgi:PKD repeat protein
MIKIKKQHFFMKQKRSNGGSVPSTHTNTHRNAGFQRSFLFIMMLFALMLKVDVGWGQGCNGCANSVLNPIFNMDLEPTPIDGKGEYSFQRGYVSGWFAAFNSAHHIQYNPNVNPPLCDYTYQNSNGNELLCMATHQNGYSEGIYTEDVPNIVYDGFEQYCINLDIQKLQCSENDHPMVVDIRLGSGLSPWPIEMNDYLAVNQFSNNTLILHSEPIDDYSVKSINLSFDMSQSSGWFDQLMINTRKINPNGTIINAIYVTVNNVSVSCSTTALTGFVEDVFPNNTVDFVADYNPDAGFWIDTFKWTFGDGSSSTEANPNHPYASSGVYTVCLEIVNENGCCASYCRDILVNCDPLPFNITSKLDCPNAEFSAINTNGITAGISYAWNFGDGTEATGGNVFHTYTQNGNYTVTCVATNNCGQTLTQTNTVAINCLCPTPVPNFTSVVNCSGHTNSVTFTSTSTGQGLSYFWEFGDGSTSPLQNPTYTYTNNGTYTVDLTVTDACGTIATFRRIVTVQCSPLGNYQCGRSTYNGYLIDASNGNVNFAQYALQNGLTNQTSPSAFMNFFNLTFIIKGNVVMDRNLSFNGCTFVFDGGASLELNTVKKQNYIIFYSSQLFACGDVMWKGVKSINGNHRFLFGTEIRDAEYGIEMPIGALGDVAANNARFFDNIVGIYVRNNSGHSIRNSTFSSTMDTNLGAYPNQTHHFSRPKAGILFENISSGIVGSELISGNNTFIKLSNGILSFNTNLSCIGNTFDQITNTFPGLLDIHEPTDPFVTNRNAVWVYGASNHHIKNNSFIGNNTLKQILCKDIVGAELILIEANNIIGESAGITFNNVQNSNIVIRNHKNNFFPNGQISANKGIVYELLNQNNSISIKDNIFNNNGIGGGFISLTNFNDTKLKEIRDNQFNMFHPINGNGAKIGVNLTSGRFVNVLDNDFNSYYSNSSNLKISIVDDLILENNRFHNFALTPTLISTAIFTNISKATFECNEVYGAALGFDFRGNSSSIIDFRSNLMHLNDIGIQVSGVFTAQRDKGNLWVGDDNGGKSYAKHLSGGSDTWFVNNLQTPPALFPTGSFRPVTVEPAFWFDDRDVENIHCFGGREEGEGEEDTPQAKAMELAGYLTDEVEDTAMLRWEWQTSLYELLTEYPALMDVDELLATLYTEMPYTIGIYKDAFDGLSELLVLTELESTTLTNVRSSMEQLQMQIDALRAQTEQEVDLEGEGNANEIPNSDEIYNQIQSLSQQLSMLKTDENSILADIQSRINEDLDNYIAEISSMPETEVFHPEFKAMMGIKANMYRHGFEYLASNNMAQLETIASLCYAGYGWAAAEAVSILGSLGQNLELNYGSCDEMENRKSLSTLENKSHVQIYPNPATDRFTIAVAGQKVSSVIVTSMDGSVQKSLTYHTNSGCDISSLPLGIYLVDVLVNGKYLSTVKFIKIK